MEKIVSKKVQNKKAGNTKTGKSINTGKSRRENSKAGSANAAKSRAGIINSGNKFIEDGDIFKDEIFQNEFFKKSTFLKKSGKSAAVESNLDKRECAGKGFKKPVKGKDGIRKDNVQKEGRRKKIENGQIVCPVYKKCGGCQLQGIPYEEQLRQKEEMIRKLIGKYCGKIHPIIGMDNPYHYRNKVHAVFDRDQRGNPISGVYQANTHKVISVEACMIEDQKADEIIQSIRGMLKSFKIRIYDEDTGYGLLRHVLVKRGVQTGQIMVVLVTASPVFPSKNNFVKAILKLHPEITTIIQNINNRGTSMVLGNKEHTLYGKGYIEDVLCGMRFRISSKSFYQINPVQTEVLYQKAMDMACLSGTETVIDAYCGIGTIGLIAGKKAKKVIGVELNRDAVHDAVVNGKLNQVENANFYCADASEFMCQMADQNTKADVVFMDPPRSGSSEVFIDAIDRLSPERVVYISCGPESLARDLVWFRQKGYVAVEGWIVDMFCFTGHVETAVLLVRKG